MLDNDDPLRGFILETTTVHTIQMSRMMAQRKLHTIKIPYIPKSMCVQGKMAAKPEVNIVDCPCRSLPPLTTVPI